MGGGDWCTAAGCVVGGQHGHILHVPNDGVFEAVGQGLGLDLVVVADAAVVVTAGEPAGGGGGLPGWPCWGWSGCLG